MFTRMALQSNRIGDAGATALATALRVHPSLTAMALQDNAINAIGIARAQAMATLRARFIRNWHTRASAELVVPKLFNRSHLIPLEASDEGADQAHARLTPPPPAPEMTLDEAMAEIRRLEAENQRLSAELARQRA